MPTPQRRQPAGVIARLLAEPHRFGFFQAVRVLNRWLSRSEGQGPTRALDERLHFRNNLSLAFPPSEIATFDVAYAKDGLHEPPASAAIEGQRQLDTQAAHATDARHATHITRATHVAPAAQASAPPAANVESIVMTPAFMGLLGTGGALPIFYTEMLAERETFHRDRAARAFLDIFQHRAVTLFYEAWRKHRLAIQYEDDERHRFLPLVLAMGGIGQSALRERLHGDEGGVTDDTLGYFAGLLQQRPVSAASVRQVVAEYFAVPVHVEQFVGRWFNLPAESSSLLGMANAQIGFDAVIGERVWQRDLRMRLTIGPMPRAKLHRFLPGGPAALALRELLTLLTGVTLEYEVRLSLRASDVQGSRLDEGADGVHLGWDSFLVTRPEHADRSDAGYDIHTLH